ncbi:MAG: Nudix family hydrolase [Methylotenera sp.]|nr:Nudix family hydrolase [Methylotenera sp.]
MTNITEAAVGVIQRNDGMVLLAERPLGKAWAGYWEFPGGKVEEGEIADFALKRELQEELGIIVKSFYPWLTRSFDYPAKYDALGNLEAPEKTVKLHFFIVSAWIGEPSGLENQVISWQWPDQLTVSPMLPANTPILRALNLPSVYAVTNLGELGEAIFFKRLNKALDEGLMMIQVREKQLTPADLRLFMVRVMNMAAPYQAKVMVNSTSHYSDLNLVHDLNVPGIHFTSQDLMRLQVKPDHMWCGASCHNGQELAKAESLGLDYVTLSPVKTTLSHTDAVPLGWERFSDLIRGYSLPVYALGGMQMADLNTARLHGAHGVAMLRDFWR